MDASGAGRQDLPGGMDKGCRRMAVRRGNEALKLTESSELLR
jgi:hypothetical protein